MKAKVLTIFAYLSLTATVFLVGCGTTATKPPTAASNPLVGEWDIVMKTSMGERASTLIIAEDLSGSMVSEKSGSSPVTNVRVDGDSVAFDSALNAMGKSIDLEFSGTIEGDSLNGKISSSFGVFTTTGSRK
jgi:hypothetical protein